ncbi:MAG: hypothetical protein M3Y37_06480 [Chloroflexota bacterium]|jgi:hypothetical protein|nr:hypothetical protein [Chloroflexota bacterium]
MDRPLPTPGRPDSATLALLREVDLTMADLAHPDGHDVDHAAPGFEIRNRFVMTSAERRRFRRRMRRILPAKQGRIAAFE